MTDDGGKCENILTGVLWFCFEERSRLIGELYSNMTLSHTQDLLDEKMIYGVFWFCYLCRLFNRTELTGIIWWHSIKWWIDGCFEGMQYITSNVHHSPPTTQFFWVRRSSCLSEAVSMARVKIVCAEKQVLSDPLSHLPSTSTASQHCVLYSVYCRDRHDSPHDGEGMQHRGFRWPIYVTSALMGTTLWMYCARTGSHSSLSLCNLLHQSQLNAMLCGLRTGHFIPSSLLLSSHPLQKLYGCTVHAASNKWSRLKGKFSVWRMLNADQSSNLPKQKQHSLQNVSKGLHREFR